MTGDRSVCRNGMESLKRTSRDYGDERWSPRHPSVLDGRVSSMGEALGHNPSAPIEKREGSIGLVAQN